MRQTICIPQDAPGQHPYPAEEVLLRRVVIGLMAFLTVVDLFATQAVLPALTTAYGVTPAAMAFAVNAATLGMAAGGLTAALLGRRLERRRSILISLLLLTLPTALLATMPGLPVFTLLRILQGLCMSMAFALTLAYLGEHFSGAGAAAAVAAYITGNVASNLVGRLVATGLVDQFGLAANFAVFAGLNLCGALLAWFSLERTPPLQRPVAQGVATLGDWRSPLRDPALRAAFGIGFLILCAFIGTFTYVNFVLVREPFRIGMMMLGAVYFVFLPSIVTTPLTGRVVAHLGTRPALWASLALAAAGLPLLLGRSIVLVLAGLALFGVGTFLAQATATGYVGRAAASDRGTASGLYLASYFLGGLVGSAVLGRIFDSFGWTACVIGIGGSLALAAALAARLKDGNSRKLT